MYLREQFLDTSSAVCHSLFFTAIHPIMGISIGKFKNDLTISLPIAVLNAYSVQIFDAYPISRYRYFRIEKPSLLGQHYPTQATEGTTGVSSVALMNPGLLIKSCNIRIYDVPQIQQCFSVSRIAILFQA